MGWVCYIMLYLHTWDLGTRQTIASLDSIDSRALELMHFHSHVYVYLLWRSNVKAFHLLCASLCEWCQVISIVGSFTCGLRCVDTVPSLRAVCVAKASLEVLRDQEWHLSRRR